jgi:hypothetical protein
MDLRRAARKLSVLRKALALRSDSPLKADLESLAKISLTAAGMHEKTEVRYRFYNFVEGHEVVLGTAAP